MALDRQRAHDERWQREVLSGLDRILAVLHDISDNTRELLRGNSERPAETADTERTESPQAMLSIDDLAEILGVSRTTVYGLRYRGEGPPSVKVGRSIRYDRREVDTWLEERREPQPGGTRPWKGAYLPGRIGSGVPASSEPPAVRTCTGSHTEPTAASEYSGRGICRECGDHVIVNKDGRLRKHRPRWW